MGFGCNYTVFYLNPSFWIENQILKPRSLDGNEEKGCELAHKYTSPILKTLFIAWEENGWGLERNYTVLYLNPGKEWDLAHNYISPLLRPLLFG